MAYMELSQNPPKKNTHRGGSAPNGVCAVAIDSMNFEIVMLPSNICSPLKGGLVFNSKQNWLVVSTHLKNISQIGSFPQIGVKIKNV